MQSDWSFADRVVLAVAILGLVFLVGSFAAWLVFGEAWGFWGVVAMAGLNLWVQPAMRRLARKSSGGA